MSTPMEAGKEAFAKVYNDPATMTACIEAAINAALAAEHERIIKVMRDGFWALDNETQAVLAAMFARWAAAMTDDPVLLSDMADLMGGAS